MMIGVGNLCSYRAAFVALGMSLLSSSSFAACTFSFDSTSSSGSAALNYDFTSPSATKTASLSFVVNASDDAGDITSPDLFDCTGKKSGSSLEDMRPDSSNQKTYGVYFVLEGVSSSTYSKFKPSITSDSATSNVLHANDPVSSGSGSISSIGGRFLTFTVSGDDFTSSQSNTAGKRTSNSISVNYTLSIPPGTFASPGGAGYNLSFRPVVFSCGSDGICGSGATVTTSSFTSPVMVAINPQEVIAIAWDESSGGTFTPDGTLSSWAGSTAGKRTASQQTAVIRNVNGSWVPTENRTLWVLSNSSWKFDGITSANSGYVLRTNSSSISEDSKKKIPYKLSYRGSWASGGSASGNVWDSEGYSAASVITPGAGQIDFPALSSIDDLPSSFEFWTEFESGAFTGKLSGRYNDVITIKIVSGV